MPPFTGPRPRAAIGSSSQSRRPALPSLRLCNKVSSIQRHRLKLFPDVLAELLERLRIEQQAVATGADEVPLAKLRECETDRLPCRPDGLRQLLVGDSQDHAAVI